MITLRKKEPNRKKKVDIKREPMVTLQITPNLSPEKDVEWVSPYEKRRGTFGSKKEKETATDGQTKLLLQAITGVFRSFYLPHHVRVNKDGVKVKLADVVAFQLVIEDNQLKFYLTVPKKWQPTFLTAIQKDWNQVEVSVVEEGYVTLDTKKTQTMDIFLKNHYALAIETGDNPSELFYSSIASLAETMKPREKLLLDMEIQPVDDRWKVEATRKLQAYKKGISPVRAGDWTLMGIFFKLFDVFNLVVEEFVFAIEEIMGLSQKDTDKEPLTHLPKLEYSLKKALPNTKGYTIKLQAFAEAEEKRRSTHLLKSTATALSAFDGENQFQTRIVSSKRQVDTKWQSIYKRKPLLTMERGKDVFSEKEVAELFRLPSREVMEENKRAIPHDSYSRLEIDTAFKEATLDSAIPFAKTLDKQPTRLLLGGYEREPWTDKGRYVANRRALDDRSTATMVFGGQGSGKTSLSTSQVLYTFGVHLFNRYQDTLSPEALMEKWKQESKSAVVFDVADGEMISNLYSYIPEALKDRVIILNHNNTSHPIAVNNADLQEFNRTHQNDRHYARVLAEMEGGLINELLQTEKSISMDRYFITALQCAHEANEDYGFVEAIRILTDSNYRNNEIIPQLTNRKSVIELQRYNVLEESGKLDKILQTIDNRLAQLESNTSLWNCIAQPPIRREDGTNALNFRTLMDGDENGAYLVLIYIPKSNVSTTYRKYIFAHYFTKIWNVAVSRESGFAGREYRPETLVVIDEVHQIIDIKLVAKLFIDLFKEPRKYSLRLFLTLHGWSSIAKAGKGFEGDIKQSIMDNGCNLIMLKGGEESFKSFHHLLQPMNEADFRNLMNLDYCGIFRIAWNNTNHVFQAKLLETVDSNKDFTLIKAYSPDFLSSYVSPYSRRAEDVEDDILDRSESLLAQSMELLKLTGGNEEWENLKKIGTQETSKVVLPKNTSKPIVT